MPSLKLLGISCLLICLCATDASAQIPPGLPIPPDRFAISHILGSSSVVNLRHYGMGGTYVADDRNAWHGNPAGMVSVRRPTGMSQLVVAPFRRLPDLQSAFLGVGLPIGSRAVVKGFYTRVSGDGALLGGPAPVHLRMREDDAGLEFAYRLSPKWAGGVSTAYIRTDSRYRVAGVGEVTRLSSHPTGVGGRVGAVYRSSDTWSFGVVYDNYLEEVTQTAPAFALQSRSFLFHSTRARIGGMYRPDSRTTFALDFELLEIEGNRTHLKREYLMLGAERRIGVGALRMGLMDGCFTAGAGITYGRFDLSYGYSTRYGRDVPSQGSEPAHALQLTASF